MRHSLSLGSLSQIKLYGISACKIQIENIEHFVYYYQYVSRLFDRPYSLRFQ